MNLKSNVSKLVLMAALCASTAANAETIEEAEVDIITVTATKQNEMYLKHQPRSQ